MPSGSFGPTTAGRMDAYVDELQAAGGSLVMLAELGMEAVWRIEVEDFPAFVVVDDEGNDFFDAVSRPVDIRRPDSPGAADARSRAATRDNGRRWGTIAGGAHSASR